jgi:hypothetical protein
VRQQRKVQVQIRAIESQEGGSPWPS